MALACCILPLSARSQSFGSIQVLHGRSHFLDALLRANSDSDLAENALIDLLMDLLADESPCPPHRSHGLCESTILLRLYVWSCTSSGGVMSNVANEMRAELQTEVALGQ